MLSLLEAYDFHTSSVRALSVLCAHRVLKQRCHRKLHPDVSIETIALAGHLRRWVEHAAAPDRHGLPKAGESALHKTHLDLTLRRSAPETTTGDESASGEPDRSHDGDGQNETHDNPRLRSGAPACDATRLSSWDYRRRMIAERGRRSG